MIVVGMLFLWVGYSAVYVGLYRITGDQRNVRAIFTGASA